jgi:hypothetical protein
MRSLLWMAQKGVDGSRTAIPLGRHWAMLDGSFMAACAHNQQ